MAKPRTKQYRIGMKRKDGTVVKSGVQQGATSKHQRGATHKVKGLRVNHNRSR